MDQASQIAVFSAGGFFLAGLLFGVWKYVHIARSATAAAPIYVDIAHRAALMYAFACLVIERFATLSRLPAPVELAAVLAQVTFFALAVSTYVVHGVLRDTDNQLARPHRLGRGEMPGFLVVGFMGALCVFEIGGFVVLLYGAATAP
ncbi:MAG: hypothetical protein H5U40_14300 [Polyangiaceae bacterium]|nr:hypothetical protein [Polyangiaceae bacterium]